MDHKLLFFLLGFSLKNTGNSQDSRGREGTIFYFTLPLPPLTNIQKFICNFAPEMTITYFQSQRMYLPDCCSMRFATLLNCYLIDWWCDVDFRLFACCFDFRFYYSYLTWETGGRKLASIIIPVLEAIRLTKCASHLKLLITKLCEYGSFSFCLKPNLFFPET